MHLPYLRSQLNGNLTIVPLEHHRISVRHLQSVAMLRYVHDPLNLYGYAQLKSLSQNALGY